MIDITPEDREPFYGADDGWTDSHLAARIARDVLHGKFLYVETFGWHRWNDAYWERLRSDDTVRESVRVFLTRAVQKLAMEAPDITDGEAVKAHQSKVNVARSALKANRIRDITTLARSAPAVREDNPGKLDNEPELLCVGNGVVNLRTGELLPHSPDYLFTKSTGVDYIPGATHEDWDAALSSLPDPEVREWFQTVCGQAITGYSLPQVPFLVGGGENGKTAVMDGLRRAAGLFSADIESDAFMAQTHGAGHTEPKMAFRGARLAIAEELPEGHELNVNKFKSIIDTDTMKGSAKGEKAVMWQATHTLFVTTNHLPVVRENTRAVWRRVLVVDFPLTYSENPSKPHERLADGGLKDRLKAGKHGQHEATLAWLIEGARRWFEHYAPETRQTLAAPSRVQSDTWKWQAENDWMAQYAEDRVAFDANAGVSAVHLLGDVNEWLKGQGKREINARTLATHVQDSAVWESVDGPKKLRSEHVTSSPLWSTPQTGSTCRGYLGVRFACS